MNREERKNRKESGFALIMAILALMLLTFLGLTLAVTSSTELQIATNYRWSQQALYNAEAGMQAARVILSNAADPLTGLRPVLPTVRAPGWTPGAAVPLAGPNGGGFPAGARDLYQQGCPADLNRGMTGYGLVLSDGVTVYENQSTFRGANLN